MATTATRSEYRSTRPFGLVLVTNTSAYWYRAAGLADPSNTLILTDTLGRTVTFTAGDAAGGAGATTPTRVSATSYLFGLDGAGTTTVIATRIKEAVNLAESNGDLAIIAVGGRVDNEAGLIQLIKPQVYDQGSWTSIGGTAQDDSVATYTNFSAKAPGGVDSTASHEFPVDDLYIKPHVVAAPDFTLHHYDLDHVDANFNITSTTNDNPRQAPFSKRFQLVRSTTGDTTTLG